MLQIVHCGLHCVVALTCFSTWLISTIGFIAITVCQCDRMANMNTESINHEFHEEEVVGTMEIEFESEKCLLCGSDTGESVSVLSRGTDIFVQQCRVTGREHLIQHIMMFPTQPQLLHVSCRRALAYEAHKADIAQTELQGEERRLTRSLTGGFSFKEMCFLCANPVNDCKDMRKVLSGTEFDNRIREAIRARGGDKWAVEVQGRVDTVVDLFAADAVYHRNCHTRFIGQLPRTPLKLKRGRPQNTA